MKVSDKHMFWLKATLIYFSVLVAVVLITRNIVREELAAELQSELLKLDQRLHYTLLHYKAVPQILQTSEVILNALKSPADDNVKRANQQLNQINEDLKADISYLMNADGITIASSNYSDEDSFIGKDFSFRPYFKKSAQGLNANYFALGTTTGKRGYYFASPVISEQQILGIIVIKVSLAFIDEMWRYPDMDFLITDSDGVIFFSSQEHWLYRTTYPLSEQRISEIQASQRYGDTELKAQFSDDIQLQDTHSGLVADSEGKNWLVVSAHMPQWELYTYAIKRQSSIWSMVYLYVAVYTLIMLLIFMLVLYVSKRRELQSHLSDMNNQLESRVNELTSDLRQSNRDLQQLVDHYQQAQSELKDTEHQLVQATKLAVLGEFSASLHHELAQPLQALQSYTSNSKKMLQKGYTDAINQNLDEISGICNSMTGIIKQFKIFARRTTPDPRPVALSEIINATCAIVAPRIHDKGIEFDIQTEDCQVYCEPVLVEQVLVNLINNAIQALNEISNPTIKLTGFAEHNQVKLSVEDNGPGLDANELDKIFEPFYTTKETGLGLGLTISKRIMESQLGELDVSRASSGGLSFTLTLKTQHGTQS